MNPQSEPGPPHVRAQSTAIPKSRANSRSQGRGTTATSSLPLPTRGSPRCKPKAPESLAIPEDRINRFIWASVDRDSIAVMISDQISSAFRNQNIAQSAREARDNPPYEEEREAAPPFRHQSNASRPEDSLGGRQHGACVSFGYSDIDRPDRISNTISNWRIKSLGHPMTFLSKTLYFESFGLPHRA